MIRAREFHLTPLAAPCPRKRGSVIRTVARAAAAALLLAAPLVAAPSLKSMKPLGARRGTTFTLTLSGRELTQGSELVSDLPATITRLAPPRDMKTPDTELPFLIELRPDAAIGVYPVRLKNPDGISNVLLLDVGDLPELEPAEEPALLEPRAERTPRLVRPPVACGGTLRDAGRDVYRFTAQAGQSLVFEVVARRLGSAIDPVIHVEDAKGRELAVSDDAPGLRGDARVEVKFQQAAEYRVVVHDSRFSTQDQAFYRLKIGSYRYADGMFPAGWQRGKPVDVTLFGGNLPAPVVVRADLALPASRRFTPVSLPDSRGAGSLPFAFAVGDLPERIEPSGAGPFDLESDTVMNGRIAEPGEVDRYRLAVKPGEKWFFEVEAARLETSRMGAYLAVTDASGKVLASAVDGSGLSTQKEFSFTPAEKGADPKLLFLVPAGVTEVRVAVEEITRRGGPGYVYRLRATRHWEDFSLEAVAPFVNIPAGGRASVLVRVNRETYAGPLQLTVANAGADLAVEGGHVPAGLREGLLVVSAKPGAAPALRALEVWGEASSSTGETIRRRAFAPGLVTPVKGSRREVSGRWLGMDLAVGFTRPAPLELQLSERRIKLVQGLAHNLTLSVTRNLPISTAIPVAGQRPGTIDVTIKGGSLEASKNTLPVQLAAGVTAAIGTFDIALQARPDLGGRETIVTSPPLVIELVRAFAVQVTAEEIVLARGGAAEIAGKVHRQYPYQEEVGLKVEDLPLDVTAESVDVPSSDAAFKIQLRAGAAAEPGEYTVRLAATGKMAGRKEAKDYTVPDRVLRLRVVAPAATTSNGQGKDQ
jgi:hypothetical protein